MDYPVMKKVICIGLSLMFVGVSVFAGANDGFDDGIDRSDSNFVIASLIMVSSSDSLYSGLGHVCIRLECPKFNLDCCYTEESEDVGHRVLTYFAGKLRMGMFAMKTEKFLSGFRTERRGVRQYRLNLPPEVKQRLWKAFDERVAQGPNMPYDYEKRGCAWAVLSCILEALGPVKLEIPEWTEKYDLTRRELMHRVLGEYPWNMFFLHAIWGAALDKDLPKLEKIVVPRDLLEFLKKARIGGVPVVDGSSVELVADGRPPHSPTWFTPMAAAVLLLLLSVIRLVLSSSRWRIVLDGLFLALQSAAGLFFCYLVCFSSLPATTWNWLIVPFNLLPLILWRWRRRWAWPFVAVLVAWEALMLLYPHQLTDWAYVVIVLAYIVFYVKQGSPNLVRPTFFRR